MNEDKYVVLINGEAVANPFNRMRTNTAMQRVMIFGYMLLTCKVTAHSSLRAQKQTSLRVGAKKYSALLNLQNKEREILKEQSNNTHTERLTIRISKNLLEKVRKKAKENELSISAYVRMILKRDK